ncbi:MULTISPECIES: hypothetical protein [Streptomyces]|uniref:Secreted protein n=1 Tax=Streptomyces stelliscabiei TaxID=146820 RepID=A0A8I0TWP3_9ACTN|nr:MULTISPECIES: hypothetical protein [Streptomyces]KND42480.1 hypothetical protein IQ64_23510 [Streptomyces stelliscabiei]MBE1602271.1 hypothetical protein [Streptomyces stelliscabiei]MDX2514476.1 hypothetical protein [Streptomyces stelliscabiei]MDX2552259.1 hypothetical protein [Streptomyces stelliscabiei]MDX2611654.1 hypothetical protein [Streptomyces stelliscabiei]
MVVRRVAAAVVLLAAALMLHLATPHHPAESPGALDSLAAFSAPASLVATDSSTAQERAVAHHEASADTLVRPPRAAQPQAEPTTAVADLGDGPADARTASGTTRPRTAREARTPAAGEAPTPSALQTFRH